MLDSEKESILRWAKEKLLVKQFEKSTFVKTLSLNRLDAPQEEGQVALYGLKDLV